MFGSFEKKPKKKKTKKKCQSYKKTPSTSWGGDINERKMIGQINLGPNKKGDSDISVCDTSVSKMLGKNQFGRRDRPHR